MLVGFQLLFPAAAIAVAACLMCADRSALGCVTLVSRWFAGVVIAVRGASPRFLVRYEDDDVAWEPSRPEWIRREQTAAAATEQQQGQQQQGQQQGQQQQQQQQEEQQQQQQQEDDERMELVD
jgi:hypothetical protein